MFLNNILKPVFLIAIVAVAMIGVMVPSSFAQITSQDKIEPKLFVMNERDENVDQYPRGGFLTVDGEFSISKIKVVEDVNRYGDRVVSFYVNYRILDESYFDSLPSDWSVGTNAPPSWDSRSVRLNFHAISDGNWYSHYRQTNDPNSECFQNVSQAITKETGNSGYVKICLGPFQDKAWLDKVSIFWTEGGDPRKDSRFLIDTISIKSELMKQNSGTSDSKMDDDSMMGEFEVVIVIGVIIGVVSVIIAFLVLNMKYGMYSEQSSADLKKYKKESDEISKKLDKLKETTNQDEALPKGFKKDTD